MIIAIYRMHYGVDFIENSIKSIIDDVDKVFIFFSKKPWVTQNKLTYRNKIIDFPSNPENVEIHLSKIFSGNKKIKILNYECNTPLNNLVYYIIKS